MGNGYNTKKVAWWWQLLEIWGSKKRLCPTYPTDFELSCRFKGKVSVEGRIFKLIW